MECYSCVSFPPLNVCNIWGKFDITNTLLFIIYHYYNMTISYVHSRVHECTCLCAHHRKWLDVFIVPSP